MNIRETSTNISSRPLSRVQTAKLRKTLQKTINSIQKKRMSSGNIRNNSSKIKQAASSGSNFLSFRSIENLSKENLYKNKNILESRAKSSYSNKLKTFKKTKLTEIRIQNLFTEKLFKNIKNSKNNFKAADDIAYKKLVMRAKLLKAAKNNVVLRAKDFEEFNKKFYVGSKTLSDKLNHNKFCNDDEDDSFSKDKKNKKIIQKPNFNLPKKPDVFSTYQTTTFFQDYYCTPMELIKKCFNEDERKIIDLDPVFFRLNKEPFCGIAKTLGFNLKDKFNEEDRIEKQKLKTFRERKEKLKIINRKRSSIFLRNKKSNFKTVNDKNVSDNKILSNKNSENKNINNNVYSRNKVIKNYSQNNKYKKEYIPINLKSNRVKKTKINSFLKSYKKQNNNISSVLIDDDERIKEKNDKMPLDELFEMFNERKKNYLEDLSYNRTKNLYKFETLRKKHRDHINNENHQKEEMRQLILKIEENYKGNQK